MMMMMMMTMMTMMMMMTLTTMMVIMMMMMMMMMMMEAFLAKYERCGAVSLGKALRLYVHLLDPAVNRVPGLTVTVCGNSSSAAMAEANRSHNQGEKVLTQVQYYALIDLHIASPP